MSNNLYFSYGANLHLQSMATRCPNARPLRPAILENYQLIFSRVASIEPCLGSKVQGALWEITDQCERNLDLFEGYPSFYRKEIVKIDTQPAMVYVMNHTYPEPPGQHYLATITKGYRDWGLNVKKLLQAVDNTDKSARHGANMY
jgi:gamma-glutamylcyclotransferase (GGCT)/AIG2-like uncharacterized protein YtfP